jgi:hypothetical protein
VGLRFTPLRAETEAWVREVVDDASSRRP